MDVKLSIENACIHHCVYTYLLCIKLNLNVMETWKIITNVILTVIILALTVVVIVDYIKHKDDESISAEDLKQLRKSHFIFAMLVAIGLLYSHICRFFV